jgi:hypothetical protein
MLYPAELRVRLAVHFADWPRLGQRPFGSIVSRVALWSCEQTQNRFDAAGDFTQRLDKGTRKRHR